MMVLFVSRETSQTQFLFIFVNSVFPFIKKKKSFFLKQVSVSVFVVHFRPFDSFFGPKTNQMIWGPTN